MLIEKLRTWDMITKKFSSIQIFFVLLLVCNFNFVNAQPLQNNFEHFTKNDGLPSDEINAIMQDHLGYLWIGTNNGLSRYDGYSFENFTVVKGNTKYLQLPLVTDLYEDSEYNIWIGAVGGIMKYNRLEETFTLYDFNEYERAEERTLFVTSIQETKNGDIIFGVFDFFFDDIKNGLYQIKAGSKKVELLDLADHIRTNAVSLILPKQDDLFYIATFDGIAEYDHKLHKFISYPLNRNNGVTAVLPDSNFLWLGMAGDGLYHYNIEEEKYKKITLFDHLVKYNDFLLIWDIKFDNIGNILITSNRGLAQLNKKTGKISYVNYDINNPGALHSYDLRYILFDKTGSLWITSRDAGISKYNLGQNNFNIFTHDPNDNSSIGPGWVASIFELSHNKILFKTEDEGLSLYDKISDSFSHIPILKNQLIEKIIRDNNNQIWICGSGLFKLNTSNWSTTEVKLPISLEQNVIHTIFEDSRNTFWLGTANGVYIYDKENNQFSKIDFEALRIGTKVSNDVGNIVEDKNNNIWFGSNDGLFKYSIIEKNFSRFGYGKDSTSTLNSQDVNSLYTDANNILWVGTWLGGLNKINTQTGEIKSFSKKDGFNSHSVQAILGDKKNGTLWLSSFDGISMFNISDESFQNFGIDDGISGYQFADRSALKTSDGEFLFGGQNGVTMFKPGDIKKDLFPPELLITQFKLFNEIVKHGENSLLKKPINETENIQLNYDENDISFNFSAIHFANPKKNQYAYRLKNYQDDWRFVGTQRSAIYPNLPPGNYIFQVKASNNNDVWNEEGKSIEIIISSPPWQTWWAYLSYALFGLGFLYTIRAIELKRQKKNTTIKESHLRAEAAELQARVIQAENDRKTQELEEARQLQLSMLPKKLPIVDNLEIAVYMKTATEVGGDYYDFSISNDGTLNVGVGDATGHGMQAGTLVTIIKGLFTSEASNRGILEFFSDASRTIKDINIGRLMMAFSLLKLNGKNLEYSGAGMPPMYIYRKESNKIDEIDMQGMPLGALKNFTYKLYETELMHGDCVLLLSDGYPELANDDNEQIGYEKVQYQLLKIANNKPEEIIEYFKNFGSEWVNGKDPDDDITFLVIKVK
jgi:serine phosphatase RsbU (regulator of sigma subunit)/ligand-binding sensor domain-containing protein